MRKKLTALILLFTIISATYIWGQCRQFTEEKVVPEVGDYILTGRYQSFKLSAGDQILIFKTLNRNIKYKFIVQGDEQLPPQVHFVIKDWNDKIIFDNSKDNYSHVFEYLSDKPQRIKIYISVPKISDDAATGCVALVIGMKKVE